MPRGIRTESAGVQAGIDAGTLELKDLTAPPEVVEHMLIKNKPVKVHLSRPLAGGSSKVVGTLDSGRGVVALKVGKDDVEFSIHSQLVLYWVYVK